MNHHKMALRIDEKMEEVLDAFRPLGVATTGMLVDETGMTRPTLNRRLDRLHTAGHVRYLHESTALQQLMSDPREGETIMADRFHVTCANEDCGFVLRGEECPECGGTLHRTVTDSEKDDDTN